MFRDTGRYLIATRLNTKSQACLISRPGQISGYSLSIFITALLIAAVVISCAGCSGGGRGSSFEGPVAEAWVARYSSYAGSNYGDYPYDVAVDALGNVYVTGRSWGGDTGSDYIAVKYDSNGNEVWVSRYDGPASSEDTPEAIAVDVSGNVYVTGYSSGEGRPAEGGGPYTYDYATVKYGADGTQLWVARYNGPGDSWDMAKAVALDGSGNVYVTGTSYRGGDAVEPCATEYATIKYDGDGNQLWVARYHGPVAGSDGVAAVAVDADGYVYVTGNSAGRQCEQVVAGSTCAIYDYATIKYDANGNEVWVARYSDLSGGSSWASALALDRSGNVYVTGSRQGSGLDDYLTVKYSAAGKELWVACHDGPASRRDSARDIALDIWGNVYVTGSVTSDDGGASHADWATVKYDTNGNELWVRDYDSPRTADGIALTDEAYAIAVDGFGNAYVTGDGTFGDRGHFDSDSLTIKYDANGTRVWVACYNGPKSGGDSTRAIALDDKGNVYVVGHSATGSKDACITIKYVPE
jgi:hypothetical protein